MPHFDDGVYLFLHVYTTQFEHKLYTKSSIAYTLPKNKNYTLFVKVVRIAMSRRWPHVASLGVGTAPACQLLHRAANGNMAPPSMVVGVGLGVDAGMLTSSSSSRWQHVASVDGGMSSVDEPRLAACQLRRWPRV
jgi:hypothetical protein